MFYLQSLEHYNPLPTVLNLYTLGKMLHGIHIKMWLNFPLCDSCIWGKWDFLTTPLLTMFKYIRQQPMVQIAFIWVMSEMTVFSSKSHLSSFYSNFRLSLSVRMAAYHSFHIPFIRLDGWDEHGNHSSVNPRPRNGQKLLLPPPPTNSSWNKIEIPQQHVKKWRVGLTIIINHNVCRV